MKNRIKIFDFFSRMYDYKISISKNTNYKFR
jgi:hypothetical protein